MPGFLLVDKPKDWTSFDIVAKLRKITGIRKIGHAGTLDPFATGLLIIAIEREATKQIDAIVKTKKEYTATFTLGKTSTTHDPEGEITEHNIVSWPSKKEIQKAIKKQTGEIEQIPPMHSAIKINGQKLYNLARKGKKIDRPARKITVHNFKIITYNPPNLEVQIMCSSGTYIRAIARDLGKELETGAYCQNLRRTKIGKYKIQDATKINEITKNNWESKLITSIH